MFRSEKKALFLLFASGYLIRGAKSVPVGAYPRALQLDETKAESAGSTPIGNCSEVSQWVRILASC
ncbi:hypothetical protein, partial [Bacillus sp. P14.5]|uniref:hypothetical protein n=1 Tax=Bacillus sp. P14.5 TaxID=1983400 RepID=UPI0013B0559F